MNPVLLKESAREDRAHAYLICGSEDLCNEELKDFSLSLICSSPHKGEACGVCGCCRQFKAGTYPDYFVIEPKEKGTTKTRYFNLEEIRNVLRAASLSIPENRTRVIWFRQAEYFRAEQFNMLLKSLEEPEEGVVFLLSAAKPDSIATTIYSRCRVLRLTEDGNGTGETDGGLRNAADMLNRLMDGDMESLLNAAAGFEDKDGLSKFIADCGTVLGDNYRFRMGGGETEYPLKESFSTELIFAMWQRALAAPELLHHPIKKEMIAENFLLLMKRKDITDGNCSWCTLS